MVALRSAEAAHRVSRERVDRRAGEVEHLGKGRHDHRRSDVPDGLPRRTVSYWSIEAKGSLIAVRASVSCCSTLWTTVAS